MSIDPLQPQSYWDKILRLVGTAEEQELVDLYEKALNILVVIDHEFQRRFPARYAQWEKDHDQ